MRSDGLNAITTQRRQPLHYGIINAMNISIDNKKSNSSKPRVNRRVTPELIKEFTIKKVELGNGTAAVRELEPDIKDASRRAWLLSRKANELDSVNYIENRLEQVGVEAVERLQKLVKSDDEAIAQRSVHFAIEHQVGKAVQRSETKAVNYNIEAVLN